MSLYERGFNGDSDQGNGEGDKQEGYIYNSVPPVPPVQDPVKKHKDRTGFGWFMGKVVCVALVFGLVSGLVFRGVTSFGNRSGSSKSDNSAVASLSSGKGSLNSTKVSTATTVTDVSDIVNNVMPAIVQVTNMSVTEYRSVFGSFEKPSESAGSGIIVSQDANYIYVATNNHVVVNSQSLTVTFCDDNAVSAEVVGTDAETDLAVIKVKVSDIDSSTINKIKVATLGSSDNLSVGESAIVIGNALGYGQSVTTGVISATNREVTLQNEESGGKYTNKLIQTDAAVNPGNSGGALLNMNGEVVGIISAKYSDTSVEGMGYAIPISSASSIIQKLMNGETIDHSKDAASSSESTAYLGIYGFDVSSENAMRYEMPQGVYVSEAIKGQAADKAGIVKGDIITGIKGVSITSMSEMKNLISKQKVGDKIKIKVAVRSNNYAEKEIEVTLGDSKNAPKTEERDSDSDSSSSSNSLEDYIKQFFNGGR